MTAKQFVDFQRLFKNKSWDSYPLFPTVNNRILKLFSKLEDEEIDLILNLLEKFTWISSNSYEKCILDLFRKVEKDLLVKIKKFYYFPIVKPRDGSKLKSGLSLIYPVVGILNYLDEFNHIDKGPGNIVMNYKLLKNKKLGEDDYLVLIDDFIGSGKTLLECINQITMYGFDLHKVLIFTIAIQADGLKLIEEKGIKVYYTHIEQKGISDYFEGQDKNLKISKMQLIERKLKYDEKFSLGFEKSEALISMIKTPNNTFPIFWHEYSDDEHLTKAPFSRY